MTITIDLLSKPNIQDIGGGLQYLQTYHATIADVEYSFIHCSVEATIISNNGKVTPDEENSLLAIIEMGEYASMAWGLVDRNDGKGAVRTFLNITQHDVPMGDLAISMTFAILSRREIHGWWVDDNGTYHNEKTGFSMSLMEQNEWTFNLLATINDYIRTGNMEGFSEMEIGIVVMLLYPPFNDVLVDILKTYDDKEDVEVLARCREKAIAFGKFNAKSYN